MFHYRNHGAAFGRVLVGMEVPKKERAEVRKYLNELGYTWFDETENEAYQLFLG
jgi:threonine dehydratase